MQCKGNSENEKDLAIHITLLPLYKTFSKLTYILRVETTENVPIKPNQMVGIRSNRITTDGTRDNAAKRDVKDRIIFLPLTTEYLTWPATIKSNLFLPRWKIGIFWYAVAMTFGSVGGKI